MRGMKIVLLNDNGQISIELHECLDHRKSNAESYSIRVPIAWAISCRLYLQNPFIACNAFIALFQRPNCIILYRQFVFVGPISGLVWYFFRNSSTKLELYQLAQPGPWNEGICKMDEGAKKKSHPALEWCIQYTIHIGISTTGYGAVRLTYPQPTYFTSLHLLTPPSPPPITAHICCFIIRQTKFSAMSTVSWI